MKYKWLSVGDQDTMIRKICPLGPWMLEVMEGRWDGDKLFMYGYVSQWNETLQAYVMMEKCIDAGECDRDGTAERVMEDWFALNVLSERYFTGGSNEQSN